MATELKTPNYDEIVNTYFERIRDLRSGKGDAVERLIELWDDDGIFEFAGSPPVTGTFRGKNAIHVLYKNRLNANGMPLRLEAARGESDRDAALGLVDTEVHRTRRMGVNKVVAGWTTVVGTEDKRGFQVSGSHTFEFKNGRIASLRIVVSPRPDTTPQFRLEGLEVDDIGRLALAAWAVV
jgi:ketosteroid isomerase-like protein